MLTFSEIQADMQQLQKTCQRGVFDLATAAPETLPLLHDMKSRLQTWLDAHPEDALALEYMGYTLCYLLDYEKALPFLEKSSSLSKDRKDLISLVKLREPLSLLESLTLEPEQIIALTDYLDNTLKDNDDHSLHLTGIWLKEHVISEKHEVLLSGLRQAGAYCDCEVASNVTNF